MEWLWKGIVTMASVALVLALARRWGGSAAGLVAGLPTTTAPALAWMAGEHGLPFAAEAAAATVAAGCTMAAFSLAYAHATVARCGPRGALAWGVAAALATTGPVLACSGHLLACVALGLGGCVLALRAWPAERDTTSEAPAAVRLGATVPAAAAGGVTLGLGMVGPAIGTACSGLLASLPVVSITVATTQHAAQGPAAARQFLRGAVAGLIARIAFGTVFSAALPAAGTGWALCAGLGATLAAHLLGMGVLGRSTGDLRKAPPRGKGAKTGKTASMPPPIQRHHIF